MFMSTPISDITPLLAATRKSAASLAMSSESVKLAILKDLAARLRTHCAAILLENEKDLASFDPQNPMRDRLLLTEQRIGALADSLLPIISIASGDGPIKIKPSCRTLLANAAFSERKP